MALTYVDLGASDAQSRSVPRIVRGPNIELIWADKAALGAATIGLAIIAYLWGTAAMVAGVAGANYLMRHEIGLGLTCDFLFTAVIWLALHALDYLFGGPGRRARRLAS